MRTDRNLHFKLLGGVAVMAALALGGCNRDNAAGGATAPAASTTSTAASSGAPAAAAPTPATPPAADAATGGVAESDMEAMERHHQQAMDHAQMRAGSSKPDAAPPADSPPAPMKDM